MRNMHAQSPNERMHMYTCEEWNGVRTRSLREEGAKRDWTVLFEGFHIWCPHIFCFAPAPPSLSAKSLLFVSKLGAFFGALLCGRHMWKLPPSSHILPFSHMMLWLRTYRAAAKFLSTEKRFDELNSGKERKGEERTRRMRLALCSVTHCFLRLLIAIRETERGRE